MTDIRKTQLTPTVAKKRKGGMGIKSFSKMNKALLSKWNWRFANDRNSLWRKVISIKFGESPDGGIHAILEEVMGLVYGRKLGKNGPVSSKMRSFPLVMVGGSISGKISGVVRRPCVPDILLFSTWRQTKRPRLRTFGIEIGGLGVGLQIS